MVQNCSFTQQPLVRSRFWIQIAVVIWQRTMQGHAAANIVPVIAANRYGLEEVTPCEENGGQTSILNFYGSSFMTDETGAILSQAERQDEAILLTTYDLDKGANERLIGVSLEIEDQICIKILSDNHKK